MPHGTGALEVISLVRFVFVGLVLSSAACTDQPATPSPTAPQLIKSSNASDPDTDLVATPNGWYHRACVQAVPNGSHIDRHQIVTRLDGRAFSLRRCEHPGRVERASNATGAPDAFNPHWVEWGSYNPGTSWGQLSAIWRVPAAPVLPYDTVRDTGQVLFAFPGLQSSLTASGTILQPVLTYGPGAGYGGNFWTATSWSCGPMCQHSTTVLTVAPGDSMVGSVTASNCVRGQCTWTIVTKDLTTGGVSTYSIDDTSGYQYAVGGAMEADVLTSCADFPADGVFFKGIRLLDQSGGIATPTWTSHIQPPFTPTCNWAVTSSTDSVSLFDNSGPSLRLSGPTTGKPFTLVTVTATASKGYPPYTYSWRITGGTGSCGNQSTCTVRLGAGGTFTNFFGGVTDSRGLVALAEWTVNSCANALVVAASHGPFALLAFKC